MAVLNWRGWLDRQIQQMGYVKAGTQKGSVPITSLFRGEAPAHVDTFAKFSEAEWERLAITSSWIYSDANLIAGTFSSAKLKAMRHDGEDLQEEANHPFEVLMRKPNPYIGRAHLWRYTLLWLLLRGEAYWWNVHTPRGELAEIWPIPADRMEPIPDPKTFIRGYRYTYQDGTQREILPPWSVTFFRLPNPFDYHRGMSPISACRLGLKTDRAAQEWNFNSFEKGAPLRMMVSLPEDLGPLEFETFKQDIRDQFAEGMQYLIGRAGSLDAKAIGMVPADLEFLAGREFTREEIDRVYGIPAGFWAKEATRANSEAADNVLLEKTIMPLHTLCAEQVTTQTLTSYDDPDLCVVFEDIRKEDRALVVEERQQYWQVYTVNEARAELGMEELEDPILGGTLVPLATKQQAPGGFGGGAAPPEEEPFEIAEFKADLRRWRALALRRHREGKSLDYDFESDYIPPEVKAGILGALQNATDEEAIRNAFSYAAVPGRAWGSWSVYP